MFINDKTFILTIYNERKNFIATVSHFLKRKLNNHNYIKYSWILILYLFMNLKIELQSF